MTADLIVQPVTVEHHREPFGIGEPTPRVSWKVDTEQPGWWQAAYEVEIEPLSGTCWSSGRVASDESVLLPWQAPPLTSRERRAVRVRVWGVGDAEPSAWSADTVVEAGLLDSADWTADLVQPRLPEPGTDGEPAALLRREFRLQKPIARARLYATAQGIYQAEINGVPVGDQLLAPGWTSYSHRLRYQTYDVTSLVIEGDNAVGVELADGWFRGYLGFAGKRNVYGDRTGVLLQLEVEHPDGSRTTVVTDGSWRSTLGPVTRADIYQGETFDARRTLPGWSAPGFDGSDWAPVEIASLDTSTLVAPSGPPVRRTLTLSPQRVFSSPSGRTLVDFGQNLVGWLRVRLPDGPAGTEVRLRHAEVLEHGELGTRPLRKAAQSDAVILDGSGPLTWEPRFTFHGFRYAEVSGWPGELTAADVDAVVIHTDFERTGTFSCSDPDVNRLHENVVWGMRGNFVDVPTDCPQRDERLGWTGDLAVFAPTASFLYDISGMLRSWLADLAADQRDSGGLVPNFVPNADIIPPEVFFPPLQAEAGWGDAAILVPWTIYQRHGDLGVIVDQWDSMTTWLAAFADRAGPDLDFPGGGFMFGDWRDTAAPPDDPGAARTPWPCVATAYLARSARILAEAAALIDEPVERARFDELADRATERFRSEYTTANGRLAYPAQTAYALALALDLLRPEQRGHAGRLLAAQVLADDFHIAAGFLGTPFVCDALTGTGEVASAYELLLQRGCPSWLYPVTMGATTIWERWDSMLPDGSINPGEMTSFNHYAFGAVGDWLHRSVAGLTPDGPGYRRLRIAPQPGPGIDSAHAVHETPYGRAEVSWIRDGTTVTVDARVPPNSAGIVELPDGSDPVEVGAGRHSFSCIVPEPQPVARPAPPWSPSE